MKISLSVIIEPFYLHILYENKMVLFTSSPLSSQAYPSSVLSDLKSQHLSAQDNVVILSSDNQNVLVHTYVLRNVSILLFNLLEFSSVRCEPSVIILPSCSQSSLSALVQLCYTGYISGLSKSETDEVVLLANEMGMVITFENVETETAGDDSDDRSVIFTGNNSESFFPWDVDSDFESSDSNESNADNENLKKQLKLETQIRMKSKEHFKLSFPKSRLNRDLSNIPVKQNMNGFQGRIQKEYNNHPVGLYVGPYDQNEKLELCVQLPDSDLIFRQNIGKLGLSHAELILPSFIPTG